MSTADVPEAMRGEHDAFALLITVATARLYALASLILHDSDRAEDATQEAFVRAWREIPRLRGARQPPFLQVSPRARSPGRSAVPATAREPGRRQQPYRWRR